MTTTIHMPVHASARFNLSNTASIGPRQAHTLILLNAPRRLTSKQINDAFGVVSAKNTLDALKFKGYVSKHPRPKDRTTFSYGLTAKGRKFAAALAEAYDRLESVAADSPTPALPKGRALGLMVGATLPKAKQPKPFAV